MTGNPISAKNMIISSDYPLDKVIYQKSYQVNIGAFDFNDVQFAHDLGYLPLVNAKWSSNISLSPSYNINGGPVNNSGFKNYQTAIAADETNIYISTTNNTASNVTLYFTIYGQMASGNTSDASYTSFAGDSFIFNTDFNYTKLFLEGTVSNSSGTLTKVIPHNLNDYPQVSLWIGRGGRVSPVTYTDVDTAVTPFNTIVSYVSTASLFIEFNDTSSAQTVYYKIYVDPQ